MQAWPVVVARRMGVTVVLASIVAWEDLGAGAAGEGVAKAAVTGVRVRSRVAAGACRRRSARASCRRASRTYCVTIILRTAFSISTGRGAVACVESATKVNIATSPI